jgi:hypothetical protein
LQQPTTFILIDQSGGEDSVDQEEEEKKKLVSMSWSDMLTICGLFAVQCIYGLYMMFLDGLLAAGVPSLFIIAVACAASSVVVLPFAFALERCACAFSPCRDLALAASIVYSQFPCLLALPDSVPSCFLPIPFRKKWPKVWSPMLVLQLVVISLGG